MKLGNLNFSLIYLVSATSTLAETVETLSNAIERNARARITGGTEAGIDDYPWFVHLGGDGCGGSLVTPEFVLTAAHCYKSKVYERKAQIGKFCKSNNNCGRKKELIGVEDHFIHGGFDLNPLVHDLMLLKLERRSSIAPVVMDDGSLSPSYETGRGDLWTTGFGYTDFDSRTKSTTLRHLPLMYADNALCNDDYKDDDWVVHSEMMCAVNNIRSSQACYGDSGGPLYDKKENKLVGITSWGDSDCSTKMVVFARIADEIDWITSTICENHSLPKPKFCTVTMQPSTAPPPTTNQPSLSSSPSSTPSLLLIAIPAPQTTYFQMIAKTTSDDKLCVEFHTEENIIKLRPCDDSSHKQLWATGLDGQIRSLFDEAYCLTLIKRLETRENLKMTKCTTVKTSQIYIHNSFQKSIIQINSRNKWPLSKLKAISVSDVTSDAVVTLEWSRLGKVRKHFVQQWDIEYPDMVLES